MMKRPSNAADSRAAHFQAINYYEHHKMSTSQSTGPNNSDSEDEFSPLRCWECNVNFTSKHFLYSHLFHHIRQPYIILDRVQLPPLKITLKSRSGNFEIVNNHSKDSNIEPQISTDVNLEDSIYPSSDNSENIESNLAVIKEASDGDIEQYKDAYEKEGVTESGENLSPEYSNVEDMLQESPSASDSGCNSSEKSNDNISTGNSNSESNTSDYGSVPGAEPTPPPEPTMEYPKIRIKTTGLLKEPSSLTITEITDDNPEGDPNYNQTQDPSNLWTSSNIDDPLKLPDNDDNNILSLFNNNERAKDLGFHSSESEFISLDRLEDRNRGAMQLYNPQNQNSSPLDSLTGLPMQALAQQVSRLQQNGGASGMHQQNVLINIQQFPTGPPQPSYQPPPMYPYPQQPMHHPYQYQQPYRPPYYPPGPPGYPPQHMPPPPQPHPMGQPPMSQPSMNPPPMPQNQMNQNQKPPSSQSQNVNQSMQQNATPYRQPMPPRQPPPRQPAPGSRLPNGPRPPMGQRQPVPRQRAPMVIARGGPGVTAVRSTRPRMVRPPNGIRPPGAAIKRTAEGIQPLKAKKERFDLLTPDKDDEDCQVICMQPKNTDGGLPQIDSVQGGTSEPAESSIMHLSDSITLSVRNPPPKPVEQPKKSDAKAVANILATRGITVTATAKPKEKESPQKTNSSLPASLNLNGAVSIIPAAKTNGVSTGKSAASEPLPTVDLTDDTSTESQQAIPSQKQRPGLPFRCDLCPAQYPNAIGLNKHRQTYHKTTSGMAELVIPVINLKAPGGLQKLSALGITNYIPLQSPAADGAFAVPVVNSRNPANLTNIGATTMISLGVIRSIPRPPNNINKQGNSAPK